MAFNRVNLYQAVWDVNQNKGRIILTLDGETVVFPDRDPQLVESREMGTFDAPAFHAIIDILRNEGSLWYDRETKQLSTWTEPPGEGEG